MPTFDTPEPIITVIDIVSGHLWINASDRADTVVEVRPTDPAEDGDVQAAKQTQVEYAAGRLAVTTPKSKIRSLLGRPPSIDVTIDLPTGSRVEAKAMAEIRGSGRIGASMFDSAAGAIRLDETGRLRLRTGAGDVSVARSAGPADVRTSSGKVWIGAVDGTAAVKTANGDITLGEVTGDVRMTTANGDITVDRALATVAAKTAHGNVRVGEVVRGAVVLETGFGELEIGVADGTAAWLDVRSRHGSVRSELDPADGAEPGAETVEVRARTGFGDIVIRRS
ncbi:MAG TPA: DUF4097 family beta strand repeat-containing protein [Streptosporangiaceae bacterium]|jgi:DUF4097 and DUF4098 domain-containing protein YvlB|nr:DUF4097 family beta strand repeat-containing protein [Streptosporangiaceae bacterium]